MTYTWADLGTSSPEIICDNSGQGVQASPAKLPSLDTHSYRDKNQKTAPPIHCLVGNCFPLQTACHPGSSLHSEGKLGTILSCPGKESGMLRATQYSLPAPDSPEWDTTNPQWATTFTSHLGTPALEPMPEDCRECRRFLAVASGWASANCWMAACRALREAASLDGRMERRGNRGHGAKARRLRPSAGFLRKIRLHCIPGHHR